MILGIRLDEREQMLASYRMLLYIAVGPSTLLAFGLGLLLLHGGQVRVVSDTRGPLFELDSLNNLFVFLWERRCDEMSALANSAKIRVTMKHLHHYFSERRSET